MWKNFPGIISAAIVQHPIDGAKLKLFSENKKLKSTFFTVNYRFDKDKRDKISDNYTNCLDLV
ncbi:hypothetical protein AR685_02270 [Chryseobacterium sp. JAH]|nr:hypothetical protein AR685_02270 [Chryseobacterium sp. JAH]